ncbi:Receptor expression-enhancing protein 6, partial [Rhizoclosmatium hyalinum]
PAYQSFKAIDKHDKELTTKWLTYWVVYGFLDILEIFSDHLIYWVPFYYAFKALLVVYLIHPSFNGANVVYHKVLAPYLLKEEGVIDSNIAKIKTKVSQTFNDTVKQD